MKLLERSLTSITEELRGRAELAMKRDIQLAARSLGRETRSAWFSSSESILNGDDAAALPDRDGYVLFAAEGIRPEFLTVDPWFAGYCSVMVNLSDIAAMGGRPWAVVDVLFMGTGENERVFEGMRAASEAFGVPVVGGHTARVSGASMLSVAVIGRARRLISSHRAMPGQSLIVAIDLRGSFRGSGGNFNAATTASPEQLRQNLAVLPALAEAELIGAGKDISMAGLCGSLLMMLETSGVGATLDLARVPAPPEVDPLRWLGAFPSFGFVLAAERAHVPEVLSRFAEVGVAAAEVGSVDESRCLTLRHGAEQALYWDLSSSQLTGFGGKP